MGPHPAPGSIDQEWLGDSWLGKGGSWERGRGGGEEALLRQSLPTCPPPTQHHAWSWTSPASSFTQSSLSVAWRRGPASPQNQGPTCRDQGPGSSGEARRERSLGGKDSPAERSCATDWARRPGVADHTPSRQGPLNWQLQPASAEQDSSRSQRPGCPHGRYGVASGGGPTAGLRLQGEWGSEGTACGDQGNSAGPRSWARGWGRRPPR